MNDKSVALSSSIDACLSVTSESPSTVKPEEEPFLHFVPNSKMSFEDKSRIYNSLVSLVKEEYPFDKALQDRAVRFLKSLEPKWSFREQADNYVNHLVLSSDGSPSGFVESILTLLSSPHSRVVGASLLFLNITTSRSSTEIRHRLVESDLVPNVLAPFHSHTLPISGNDEIFVNLIEIIQDCFLLASPESLRKLNITAAVDKYNHREMIFQKVVLPSSRYVTFLISNRHILNRNLMDSFMILLSTILRICSFHRPTLEFVLASPIAMAFSSCISFIEDRSCLCGTLDNINDSLTEWTKEGAETIQSWIWMMPALISEGFEDTLEQMLMNTKGVDHGLRLVDEWQSISQKLGSNAKKPRWLHLN